MEYLLFLKRPINVDDLWSAVNSFIYRNVNTILGKNICNESNETFENNIDLKVVMFVVFVYVSITIITCKKEKQFEIVRK